MARIDKTHSSSPIHHQPKATKSKTQENQSRLFVPPAKAKSLKGRVQSHVHEDPRIAKLSEKI